MSASDRRFPSSIDDLLSTSRDHFDELFALQMSGGRAATKDASKESEAPALSQPPKSEPQRSANAIAELNRQFGLGWSFRIVRQEVDNGRVTVEVAVTVGGQDAMATGSSRVADGEDETTAVQRAVDRALRSGAKSLAEPSASQISAPTESLPPHPTSSEPADAVSIGRLEVALGNVREEMTCVLARNAVSPALATPGAGAATIMDGRGRMISGRTGSFLAHMLDDRQLHLGPGDVLLQSDPYCSAGASGSANDWLMVCPVFHGTDLAGYVSLRARPADVGGGAEGSAPADAASVFDEGIRVPPVKIYEAGALNRPVLDLILTNCRTPDANRADLMAMVAACQAGATEIASLWSRFGPEAYHKTCSALLARTRTAVSDLIVASIPEEPQSFEDVIDDDGLGNGPFPLRLTVWREGEHAYFDWTGTSAQAPGPINFYLHVGLAKAFVGQTLTRTLGRDLTGNDGFYDLIHVTLPKGSMLCPELPAAVGHPGPALARHRDVLGAAIGRHAPETLHAAGGGPAATFTYSGPGFRFADAVPQGRPAGPGHDGADHDAASTSASAEDIERAYPVVIERQCTLPDTGGAGLCRGGNGVEKIYRVLAAGHVTLHDDRHASRPWGVNGAKAGATSQKWILHAEGGREALPSKIEGLDVQPGDRIIFRTAGGGGVGNPLARDPADVRRDVAAGQLTADAAANAYGVVVDAQSLRLDLGATEQLRGGLKREKQHSKLFDRGDNA